MPNTFLHGAQIIDIDNGARTIQAVRSSVIGVVGTAPDADPLKFPINMPVLIAGRRSDAAGIGLTGTLPDAIDGIFDQLGAVICVIRVEQGANAAETLANVVGGIDDVTGKYEGVHALLACKSVIKVAPRILIAPGFTDKIAVATEMDAIATRLRAIVIVDGPNTTDAAAIAYRDLLGSKRFYLVDPAVTVFDTVTKTDVVRPASPRIAGVIAKSDAERGYWWSPSNRTIAGITGTARAIDFAFGDANSRANLLNEQEVATIIQEDGFRFWGNRTCSNDPKYAFITHVRVSDIIADSILASHLWAVDRNATRTYFDDVVEGVNNYMHGMKLQQAIAGGSCWVDHDLNSPDKMAAGEVYFDYDFSIHGIAESLTFRAHLVNDYLAEVLPVS
jgi:uncharacterized protein